MGVVGLPCLVTGLAAMSIIAEITFIPGFHASSNSSQTGSASGLACRRIFICTVFAAISYRPLSLVTSRPRLDQRGVYGFPLESGFIRIWGKISFSRFQEIGVITFREIRLIVRAARFIATQSALCHHPRQLQHVVKLAGEHERRIRPMAAIAKIDALVALKQFHDLCVSGLQALVV